MWFFAVLFVQIIPIMFNLIYLYFSTNIITMLSFTISIIFSSFTSHIIIFIFTILYSQYIPKYVLIILILLPFILCWHVPWILQITLLIDTICISVIIVVICNKCFRKAHSYIPDLCETIIYCFWSINCKIVGLLESSIFYHYEVVVKFLFPEP